MKLLYLAKPTYGGWVTFTSNLALINETHVVKLGKKTEFTKNENKKRVPKYRDFGYGVKYRNYLLDDLLRDNIDDDIVIAAIDKNYHHYLDLLPLDKVVIVIHDPTEIKSKKNFILPYLTRVKRVITIRKLVSEYLQDLDIANDFLVHPYLYKETKKELNKTGAISISRIDWDKHTDIILKANLLLDSNKVEIWGDKNDRYVYNKLKDIDSMKEDDITSCYKGKFSKNSDSLSQLLEPKKFMIDLSKIKNDGGGTQYTFLEAINYDCCLILNRQWINVPESIWKEGVNCLAVDNEIQLKNILIEDKNVDMIVKNAKKILDNHSNNLVWTF